MAELVGSHAVILYLAHDFACVKRYRPVSYFPSAV